MSTSLEVHHIGSIGSDLGQLSFSYMPERNLVSINASVPADKRRSDIYIHTSSIKSLREIIEQLEFLERTTKQRQIERARPTANEEGATFNVMNTKIFVANEILEHANKLITKGENQSLPKEIQRSFPLLTPAAVTELTHLIYIHFRPRA